MGAAGVAATVAAMLSLTPAAAEGPSFGCPAACCRRKPSFAQTRPFRRSTAHSPPAYKRKFDSLSASQRYELESAEKVWLAERNSCGTNKSCITNAYAIRISQLGG